LKRIFSLLLSILLLFSLTGCDWLPGDGGEDTPPVTEQTPPEDGSGESAPPDTPDVPDTPPEPAYLDVSIVVAGDAMSHMPQTEDALNCGGDTEYDYTPCLQYVKPRISSADIGIVNLETVFRQGKEYSGFPNFNTPNAFGYALADAGFNLIATANNHSYDQQFQGLCDTLDVLDDLGVDHVGTYRTQEEFDANMGVSLQNYGGMRIAFLDYTYGLNGHKVAADADFSVNRFNVDYATTLSDLDEEKLIRELEYAQSLQPDMICVLIHWGVEYQLVQNRYQNTVADFLIAHGADLVLGGHSHTPQPLEYRTVTLEDGSERTGFVCFSLGNFLSNQQWEFSDITALLQLTLRKDLRSGETTLHSVSYVPCLMLRRGSWQTPRYYLLEAYETLDAYAAGTAADYVDAELIQRLNKCITDCQNIFGYEFDYRVQEDNVL